MIDYTARMIARMEYEERVRSMAPILDDGGPLVIHQPEGVLQQARRLRCALDDGLAALRERMQGNRIGDFPRV